MRPAEGQLDGSVVSKDFPRLMLLLFPAFLIPGLTILQVTVSVSLWFPGTLQQVAELRSSSYAAGTEAPC